MTPSLPPLVITGANGFIGRHLLAHLHTIGHGDVVAIARDAASLTAAPHWRAGWRAVSCDLTRDRLPVGDIARDAVVLHLAAAVGKLSPAAMRRVNVEGTHRVLDDARIARASHLIFVSSIAAGFNDRRWYPYAESKYDAERIVAAGGVPYSVVRPTLVFGRESPIAKALGALATGGAPIVFGSGNVRTQPIHVADVVALLIALAGHSPARDHTLEVGGAERLTMRALLDAIRRARGLAPRHVVSVPLGVLRPALGLVEPLLRPVLPVTAGQFAAFVNDSVAADNSIVRELLPAPMDVQGILARDNAHD